MYKWPRGSKMVQNDQYNMFLTIGDHSGPLLNPLEPFQKKLDFLFLSTLIKKHFVFLWQKNYFCLKRYQMVQVGPNGQTNVILTNWDPIGPHPDIDKPAMFGHFWSKMASYGSETSLLLIFSARDDLVKVSWKLDARKCQNQVTSPYFDQLSERCQPL